MVLFCRPEWFSAIASGDIMKIKMAVRKGTIDLKEVSRMPRRFCFSFFERGIRQRFKEDQMAAFSFGDASKGANIFTPRKSSGDRAAHC